MKAKIEYKGKIGDRSNLKDVIPLRTPFLIFIEPTDKCNFKCKFCPTGDINLMKNTPTRNSGNMDFSLYKKVIDDISEFDDNIKMIQLYKDGEPLLHPQFTDMVKYAKSKSYINTVATTTNASLLNKDLSLKIIDSGLDRVNISIEGVNSEQYLNISRIKIDFKKLVDNIEFLYKNKTHLHIYIKIVGNNLSDNDKKDFYKVFGNIADSIFIENIIPIWSGIDVYNNDVKNNNLSNMGEKDIKYKNVCPNIFYSFAVNSDGSISPCCADWSRKFDIGNIKNKKIKDLWNSKEMFNLQMMFLKGKRKEHSFCGPCGLPTFGSIDNLDSYADDLIMKIEQSRAEQSRAEQSRAEH